MGLDGDPSSWAAQLVKIASTALDVLIAVPGEDPVRFVPRIGEDVTPRVRELSGRSPPVA